MDYVLSAVFGDEKSTQDEETRNFLGTVMFCGLHKNKNIVCFDNIFSVLYKKYIYIYLLTSNIHGILKFPQLQN